MTDSDTLSRLASKQARSLVLVMTALTGGTGVAWFKADGIGTTLSSVARTAERNSIILGEMRDDVSEMVTDQHATHDRVDMLKDRVTILEGQLVGLKERMEREDNGK